MVRFLLALLLLVAPPTAWACSVAPGYRVPTTLELVEEADAVVIAEARDARTTDDGEPEVSFASITMLKSPPGPGIDPDRIMVQVPGILATKAQPATASDPAELVRANPEAYSGGCTRFTFHPKQWVVLFLKREGDGCRYRVISYPFARTAEDTTLPDSRWLKAVREYVAIAALPPALRRARMEVRRDLLNARGDADSRAIAADMERELNGPR